MSDADLSGEELISLIWSFFSREILISGGDPVLDRVAMKGFLSSGRLTTFSCGGRPVYPILRCPSCGASDLETMGAWIHRRCGSVTYEEGSCPRCGRVPEGELVPIGPVYRCRSCGSIVNYPLVETPCGDPSIDTYVAYRLTDRGRRIISRLRDALDNLEGPKVLMTRLNGVRVEALLLRGPVALIIRTEDEFQRARERELTGMGLRVGFLRLEV